MQVTATPLTSSTIEDTRRRPRPKSPDGWSPAGFGQQRPGANLPPNHPMHPDNRRFVGTGAAQAGASSLGSTTEVASDASRRGRDGYQWPQPPSQRPGANLPRNHPMHPDNRR